MDNVSRRDALRAMAVTAGAVTAASVMPHGVLDAADALAATSTPPTSLTPDQAIARLAAGNRRFVNGDLRHPRRDGRRRAAVAEGQAPYAVVLGCADSRVPPEVIYDEGLGNLFVVRIAGNTATDPYVLGSVEYGGVELGAVVIVVLGHEGCGAVKAAIDVAQNGTQLPGDIGAFVAPIVPVAQRLIPTTPKDELLQAVTLANISQSVAALQQNSLLAESIAAGKLAVVGGEYQARSGKVLIP
ncbi:MAG: carbonic anhydrase [Acidimicrobiia bacterium]